jgi:hypothetical protein
MYKLQCPINSILKDKNKNKNKNIQFKKEKKRKLELTWVTHPNGFNNFLFPILFFILLNMMVY